MAVPGTPLENPPGTTSQGREPVPQPSADEATEKPGLKLGLEAFYGASNLPGSRRFRDGFWLGYGPAYPSVIYGRYLGAQGATAKVAVGVGKLYNGSMPTLRQPIEAWYQRPAGSLGVTVGKFYVPFELQEWQYETKWGVMVQGARRGLDMTGSLNYNQDTNKPNAYFRVGRALTRHATVGISLGAGEGLSYASTHNKALGLDASANYRNFDLLSSYVALRRGAAANNFDFGFAKLSYSGLGRLTPFASYHKWRDRSEQQGDYHGPTLGLTYQLSPGLTLETAYASASNRYVRWAQLHWIKEW